MVTTSTVYRPRQWQGLRRIPDGLDPEAPATLYLAADRSGSALRVGATTASANGLDDLESLGWRVITTWWFDLGFDALDAEERLLDRWRNLFSLRPRLVPNDLVDGDATTTVAASHATELDAIRYVDQIGREIRPVEPDEPTETDGTDELVERHSADSEGPCVLRTSIDPWLLAS